MAARHGDGKREEFLAFLRDMGTVRAASRAAGVSPATGQRWARQAQEPGEVGDDTLGELLRAKVVALLTDIEKLDPKGRRDVAAAINVLHQRYAVETGKATETRVTVAQEREDELDVALRSLLKAENAK